MDLGEFHRMIAREYYKAVEALLIDMPVGYTLCVHRAVWQFEEDRDKTEQVMHTLAPGFGCWAPLEIETVYGPKTDEIQKEIEEVCAGRAASTSVVKDPSTTPAAAAETGT